MKIAVKVIFFTLFFSNCAYSSDLITWNFAARISQKIGPLPELSVGDNVSGSITFISNSKNSTIESTTEANYRAIDNIRLTIHNVELIAKDKDIGFNKIIVRNNNPIGDSTAVEDVWFLGRDLRDPEVFVNKLTPLRISFFFIDKTATVFDTTELPLQPFATDDFTNTSGSIRFINSDEFIAIVTLDQIEFTPDLLAN
jgi:hypothetical protein